ncbi:ATPase, V1 complex, subunit C [Basidiobolus meristosporus CBS 931.73]|uniref:V-type proton ATPase subunit C n=1 Tax=Basidiobolus meristosporus CBS 931.73 TaxID=1314790 RepID=A0A1Y1Z714_9FUNG|nr:ATPase, V1 complex, subunit C [Basidiobolus meristosporus CBS 931.73]|eukprot:ORY05996.1 ATPase, V1 complex, subunit C [Basidiobolus meristosporus CBS 931.73]
MPQYWLVSVPANGSKDSSFQSLRTSINEVAEASALELPEFKIGTLDTLVILSDDLVKYDQAFESTVVKMVDNLKALLRGDLAQLEEALTVNEKPVDHFLKSFQWNSMKYRSDKALKEIAELINQEGSSLDSSMKAKMSQYNSVKSSLTNIERKQTGNLAVRGLADIVKKENCVLDSEYLQTLFVAVPKNLYKEWEAKYETLTEMVVPRSSSKIAEDNDYGLFSVSVFKRVVNDFSLKCREEKFIVREFEYNEEQLEEDKREYEETEASEREQWKSLLQWCKTSFGEVFSAWIHIKVLRVFVESVLRYGLPLDYSSAMIKPKAKGDSKIRDLLIKRYASLGGSFGQEDHNDHMDEYQGLIDKDYTPFVLFNIPWTVFDKEK